MNNAELLTVCSVWRLVNWRFLTISIQGMCTCVTSHLIPNRPYKGKKRPNEDLTARPWESRSNREAYDPGCARLENPQKLSGFSPSVDVKLMWPCLCAS